MRNIFNTSVKSHGVRLIGFSLGALLFYYAVSRFGGLEGIVDNLRLLGAGYLVIIFNSFLGILLYTRAWKFYLPGCDHPIHYLSLLKIKLCGEGINFLTPAGFFLGDPIRVVLLRKYLGPASHLRSVVIDRVMHSLATHLFCFFGVTFLLTQPLLFPRWLTLSLFSFYATTTTLFTTLVIDMVTGRGLGFFEPLLRWLFLPKQFPKINRKISELREDLSYYVDKPKSPFFISLLLHFTGRILGAVEIYLIFYLIQGGSSLALSVILASLTSFFVGAFGFIPGAFGVLETLYAHFFLLYQHSPDTGISVQIVRRLRSLFWIILGILILDYDEIIRILRKNRSNSSP